MHEDALRLSRDILKDAERRRIDFAIAEAHQGISFDAKWHDMFRQLSLVLGAFRHYLGRESIVVSDFAASLALAWPLLDVEVRKLIRAELTAEFFFADRHRAFDPLGGYSLNRDCDRAAWELVRKAWVSDTESEEIGG